MVAARFVGGGREHEHDRHVRFDILVLGFLLKVFAVFDERVSESWPGLLRCEATDIKTGSSYLSQNDLRAHVGVGTATSVDRLEVYWPSGRVETIRDVDVNQIVTIDEGKGIVARAAYVGRP